MSRKRPYLFLAPLVLAMSALSARVLPAQLPAAKPDQALVIFYRMSSFKEKGTRLPLNHSEGLIGQLSAGIFLYEHVEPRQQASGRR